jgi:hypothetical protein
MGNEKGMKRKVEGTLPEQRGKGQRKEVNFNIK